MTKEYEIEYVDFFGNGEMFYQVTSENGTCAHGEFKTREAALHAIECRHNIEKEMETQNGQG